MKERHTKKSRTLQRNSPLAVIPSRQTNCTFGLKNRWTTKTDELQLRSEKLSFSIVYSETKGSYTNPGKFTMKKNAIRKK